MKEYKIEISVEANTAQEAAELAAAFIRLYENMSNEDIIGMSTVIEEKPEVVSTIKKWLQDPPPLAKRALGLFGVQFN